VTNSYHVQVVIARPTIWPTVLEIEGRHSSVVVVLGGRELVKAFFHFLRIELLKF
jgi:hypothetical protein